MHNFDLTNGYVILRIICGFFMLPNAIAKMQNPAGALAFFKSAGFPHQKLFVNFTIAFELVFGLALVIGTWTPYAAGLTAIFMFVATTTDFKVNKTWLGTKGGCEYPLFWGICAAVVAFNS